MPTQGIRLELTLGGLSGAGAGLTSVAGYLDRAANGQDRVLTLAPRVVSAVKAMTTAWQELTAAQKEAGASAPRAVRVPKPGAAADNATAKAVGASQEAEKATKEKAFRFTRGPQQRLLDNQEQLNRARDLPDTDPRKSAILEDLERDRFLADRQAVLHRRRMEDREGSLNSKGLLELFGDLEKAVRGLTSGNFRSTLQSVQNLGNIFVSPGGVTAEQKLNEKPGGVNLTGILDRLTSRSPGAAPNLGDFVGLGGEAGGAGAAGASEATGALAGLSGAAGTLTTGFAGLATLLTGPVGIALAAVAFAAKGLSVAQDAAKNALKTFVSAVKEGADTLQQFAEAGRLSGARPGEVGALSSFGISPGNVPALAAQFRQVSNVTGDRYAVMARSRLGLGPVGPRPYGEVNEARDLLQAVEGLHQIFMRSGRDEAIRTARMAHLEPLLTPALASPGVFGQAEKDALVSKRFGDSNPHLEQDATDLTNNLARLSVNLGQVFTHLSASIIRPLGDLVGSLATMSRQLAPLAGQLGASVGRVTSFLATLGKAAEIIGRFAGLDKTLAVLASSLDVVTSGVTLMSGSLLTLVAQFAHVTKFVGGLISAIAPSLGKRMTGFADEVLKDLADFRKEQQAEAVRDNTAATKALTEEMRKAGTFGGGANARRGLGPSSLGADAKRRLLENHTFELGWLPTG